MESFRLFSVLLHLTFVSLTASGQQEGDQWLLGHGVGPHPIHPGIIRMDFRSGDLDLSWRSELTYKFRETQANICSKEGDLLLWTNGMDIMGNDGNLIADTIAYDYPGGHWDWFASTGDPTGGFVRHDGALILPMPDSDSQYCVIYHSAKNDPQFGAKFVVNRFLDARVQFKEDRSFSLIYKDSLISPPNHWYADRVESTRHANGRDWWIITFEIGTPLYYSYLLDPSGIRLHHIGEVINFPPGNQSVGQGAFSPSGNYLARIENIVVDSIGRYRQFIVLYNFDRCTGHLTQIHTFFETIPSSYPGIAFSPSERYLYTSIKYHLWQWDLWADDIGASQTLVDTFDGFVQPGNWPINTNFGPMMAAPDGRIYMIPTAGTSHYMHVIDRPDLPASSCNLLQHHIELKAGNNRTAPNIPNFRLGPLDGSPCDTLGLDNHPVARWRYEEDVPGWWYTIRFTDLSFYEPDTWHWDFDDGTTSDDTSPVHTFEPGLYHVCLTVSNEYASDSTCRWVEILTTSLHEERAKEPDLSISPNPFSDELVITSRSSVFRTAHIRLYDVYGRMVLNEPSAPVPLTITLPGLSPGVYLCVIEEKDGTVYSEKVMKQ